MEIVRLGVVDVTGFGVITGGNHPMLWHGTPGVEIAGGSVSVVVHELPSGTLLICPVVLPETTVGYGGRMVEPFWHCTVTGNVAVVGAV